MPIAIIAALWPNWKPGGSDSDEGKDAKRGLEGLSPISSHLLWRRYSYVCLFAFFLGIYPFTARMYARYVEKNVYFCTV